MAQVPSWAMEKKRPKNFHLEIMVVEKSRDPH